MAALRLTWFFPQLIETRWMLPPERPTAQAAIVSVPGRDGKDGKDGIDGDGATDPGDLTLIFDNQLI